MKVFNSIIVLTVIGLCYLISVLGSGCAQIGMPTGGPKDTIPPVLVKSVPPNRMLHFTGNRVTFTFDEYVHIQDLQNNLMVNPVPKIIPNVNFKLKTVSIKIRDTLQPNTTYSYEFGNAIQDVDENNPIHNFTYVFSTGSYIDSMQLMGKVILAETGKPDSTLIVMLYSDLGDSAVYKKKPKYVARLDSSGNYHFRYIAEGVYHLFALKDESGQKMYNNPSQLFAFADSAIHITQNVKPVELYAYAEEKYTKPSTSSVPIKKNPEKLLRYSNTLTSGTQDLLTPLKLQFETPLKNFDVLKIKLTDTLYHPVVGAEISLDTTGKLITVYNKWIADTYYKLEIDKDFAKDTLGDELKKSDTISFKTKSEREYGSLELDFSHLKKIAHPVLQFVQNNKVVDSFKIASPIFKVKLFNPGDYELRILDDENENGTWDPGDYHLRKQPEKVIAIPQKINIRADWDNDFNIEL